MSAERPSFRVPRAATCALLTAVLAVAAAPPAGAATAGSILYRKAGSLWVTSPDGRVKKRIPRSDGLENPSQADNGTIVAQRGVRLYRLDRRGRQLNRPITTAFRTSRLVPSVKGPFWPEVSPDGRTIAYTYSLTAERFDPSCGCTVTAPSLNTAYTPSSRFVEDPVAAFGNARMYQRASWVGSRQVLMTTQELFNFAGDVLDTIALDTVGGSSDSYQRWFSDCDPCDSLQTLRLWPLDDGEMTGRKDKLAFVSGELGTKALGTRLALHGLAAGPPAIPGDPCFITGPAGRFSSPTWSPDGRSLAWADARGIWVGRVAGLSAPTCQVSRRLLVPGGSAPDWGPARP